MKEQITQQRKRKINLSWQEFLDLFGNKHYPFNIQMWYCHNKLVLLDNWRRLLFSRGIEIESVPMAIILN